MSTVQVARLGHRNRSELVVGPGSCTADGVDGEFDLTIAVVVPPRHLVP